jgi:hypothetical protein
MDRFKINLINDSCDIALRWLKEKAVIDANGKMTINLESTKDHIFSMAVDELLVSCTSIQPNIPEFAKQQVVNQAIDRWFRYKKYKDNPDITSAYKDALSVETSKVPQNVGYQILGLININPESFLFLKPVQVGESSFRFASWSELKSINLGDLWTKAQEYLPKHIAFIFADSSRMVSTFIPFFINSPYAASETGLNSRSMA